MVPLAALAGLRVRSLRRVVVVFASVHLVDPP
jgi:hypothetical protein